VKREKRWFLLRKGGREKKGEEKEFRGTRVKGERRGGRGGERFLHIIKIILAEKQLVIVRTKGKGKGKINGN